MTYKEIDIQIGNRIKHIRSTLKMDQKAFSKKIDATVSALSNWENGRNQPNDVRMKAIADLGKITVDELKYGTTKDQKEREKAIESWQAVLNNHKRNLALLENLNDNEVYSIIETTKKEVAKIIEIINNNAEINLDDIKSELESLETGLDEYELSKNEQSETLILNIESNKRAIKLAENKLKELGAETTK